GFAEDALGDSDQRPVARPDHCEILETQGDSPRWVEAGTLRHSRVNVHAVLLPDGKVFIVGGHDSVKRNPAHIDRLIGEIYDPTVVYDPADPSAAFTETNPLQRSRNYHAAALLLPDGRVLLTGGEDNAHHGGNQTSVEIYEPPYLHNGPQPAIENVSVTNAPEDEIAYGADFTIRCRDELEASNIAQVVLMRPGSATHHTDTEQRHVPLNFSYVSGDTLRATAPLDATVAPPGYYMLWIVDGSGIPCERAPFVRLSYRKCSLITDRSSISIQEIEALPSRTIESAVYVHLDGFLPAELGVTTPTPSAELIDAWAPRISASDDGTTLTSVRLDPVEMLLEDPAMPADLRQRVTFRYRVIFDDFGAFPEDGGPDRNRLRLDVNYRDWSCDGRLDLTRQPAPYMLDGATHWLSTDVRVFRIREGESRFGVTLETGQPLRFLRDVIAAFDADPGLASHPFESIATDQSESRLQLATTEGGTPVYNFAICRARYRANSVDAQRVRMHFRAFTTAATNLNYNPATTYRSATTASSKIALPGIASGELVTIPFFGRERVNAATTALTDQTDDLNQKDLPALASGAEARRYFGAFLDLNQPDAQLPASLNPSENGPFDASDLQPLAELVRGRHQCLVAEIDFDDLPIDVGESPANNDMLSQRNLIIEGSDNPGASDSHTVAMTFDIKPTWSVREGAKNADIPPVNETRWPLTHRPAAHHGSEHDEVVTETGHHDHNDINPLADRPTHAPAPERIVGHLALGDLLGKRTDFMRDDPVGARFAPAHHEHRSPPDFSWFTPDDLMIEWGELPESSVATLYLPNLPAENIVRAARLRSPWPRMEAVDAHTLKLGVGGVSHVPLPGLSSRRLAGLLTVQLPESVRYGQEFSVVVRQASNRHSVIVGAFELRVPVRSVDELATDEARWYAVLQQIIQKMNPDNRWHAVLSRLLGLVRGRVNGFGIDADAIKPGLDPRDLEDPCPCAPAKERPEQADSDCEERKPDTPQACPNPYCECDPCLCLPPCKCGLTLDTRKTTTHWNDKKKHLHHKTVEVYKPKGG
ncbi:MAG: galactose oxidase early set domain-containing protein, partial [Pseudomonadota bacterium]